MTYTRLIDKGILQVKGTINERVVAEELDRLKEDTDKKLQSELERLAFPCSMCSKVVVSQVDHGTVGRVFGKPERSYEARAECGKDISEYCPDRLPLVLRPEGRNVLNTAEAPRQVVNHIYDAISMLQAGDRSSGGHFKSEVADKVPNLMPDFCGDCPHSSLTLNQTVTMDGSVIEELVAECQITAFKCPALDPGALREPFPIPEPKPEKATAPASLPEGYGDW